MRRKACKDCGEVKSVRQFYRHSHYADGRINTCKACKIAQVEANRELKFEQYQATKRRWSARPENVAKRQAYNSSTRGLEVHRASCRRYMRFRRMAALAQASGLG